MPSIYDIKPAFQGLLRPLSNWLAGQGVTANQVTVAALLLSALGGGLIALYPNATWPLLFVPVVLFARMALNAIDGMLAREHNMKSTLGAILNELGDVCPILCSICRSHCYPGFPDPWWWPWSFSLSSAKWRG